MKRNFYTILGFLALFSTHSNGQIITTIAGKDRIAGYSGDAGPALDARVWGPSGIARDAAGNIYIADQYNNRIRKINASGIISTIAGNDTAGFSGDGGPAAMAKLNQPRGIAVDAIGNIYFSDNLNNRVRKIDSAGNIITVAGNGSKGYNGDNIAATLAKLDQPRGIFVDKNGNIYIADEANNRIRRVDGLTGIITTVAGMGVAAFNGDAWPTATQASLNYPADVLVDDTGNIFISDTRNHRIRRVDTFKKISTYAGNLVGFAGDGGKANVCRLNLPASLAMDNYHNLYVADEYNNRVRKITQDGYIFTVAGNSNAGHVGDSVRGTIAELTHPEGIAVDSFGTIYFSEWSNNRLRKVTTTVYVGSVSSTAETIKIFPNPAAGNFTVQLNSKTTEDLRVTVVNVTGQVVGEASGITNQPVNFALDVAAGLYFVTVKTANGTWTEKAQVIH